MCIVKYDVPIQERMTHLARFFIVLTLDFTFYLKKQQYLKLCSCKIAHELTLVSVELAIIRCKEKIKNATELCAKNTAELHRKVC